MSSPTEDNLQMSGEDSDEEMDWEEVVPSASNIPLPDDYPTSKNVMEIDVPSLTEAQPIEITIRAKNRPPEKDPEAKYVTSSNFKGYRYQLLLSDYWQPSDMHSVFYDLPVIRYIPSHFWETLYLVTK